MEWPKPAQDTLDAFEAVAPPPPVERKKMFGLPAWFAGGNMFAFVFGDAIAVRLPEAERNKLIAAGGEPFGPMGRPMREYISVPPAYATKGSAAKLRPWVRKAQAYAETLPPKQPKKKKSAARAKPAAARRTASKR